MMKKILSLLLAVAVLLSLLPLTAFAGEELPSGLISDDGILTLPEYPDASYYEITIGEYIATVQGAKTFDLNKFCFDNNLDSNTYNLNVAVCDSEGLTLINYFDLFTYHGPHKKDGYITAWSEDFEGAASLPQGWTVQDKDGDGKNWEVSQTVGKPCHGNSAVASFSWDKAEATPITPDNWLTLPTQTLEAGKKYLFTFQMSAPDSYYKGDKVSVYVLDNSNNQLIKVKSDVTVSDASYHEIAVDLSAYAGKSITISVAHQNCTGQYAVVLDCFRLWKEHATQSVGEITLTGLSKPVEGSKIADNVGYLTGDNFTVNRQGWTLGISEEPTSEETFRSNDTVYCYFIELYANEGYEFTTSTVVKFRDTVLKEMSAGSNGYYYNDKRLCIFIFGERIEDMAESISSVRIEGLRQPTPGEGLTENQAYVVGSNFTVAEAAWYNATEKTPVTAPIFKSAKGYYYYIRLTADEGYQFATTTAVFLQETALQHFANIAEFYDGDSGYMATSNEMMMILYSEDLPNTPNPAPIDPCLKFEDIDRSQWYHKAIDYAIATGMMAGMSDTVFAPEGEMTRAQLVQILFNLEGKPTVSYTAAFTDVKSNDWFANAVLWAANNGVVNGVGEGRFDPDGELTREQMATILFRYFGAFKGVDTSAKADLSKFPDEKTVSSWAYEAFQWANAMSIINGTKIGGTVILAPQDVTTRAQIAQVFYNYFTT